MTNSSSDESADDEKTLAIGRDDKDTTPQAPAASAQQVDTVRSRQSSGGMLAQLFGTGKTQRVTPTIAVNSNTKLSKSEQRDERIAQLSRQLGGENGICVTESLH